jgi:hypothetical protein
MEDNNFLKRLLSYPIVFGAVGLGGAKLFSFVRNFHHDIHLAVLKGIAYPFTIVGIPMRAAERNPVMPVTQDTLATEALMNAIVYMVPLALVYVLLTWSKTSRLPAGSDAKPVPSRFPKKKVVFWIGFYLIQLAALLFLIFTGLGMAIGIPMWVAAVIEPVDYMNTGSLRYDAVALAYNVLVLAMIYEFVRYVIRSIKAIWH